MADDVADDEETTVTPTTATEATHTEETPTGATGRRGPQVLTLLVGLLTLAVAVAAFTGRTPDLSGFDVRWLFAGAAAVVGVLLLTGSLRGRRRH